MTDDSKTLLAGRNKTKSSLYLIYCIFPVGMGFIQYLELRQIESGFIDFENVWPPIARLYNSLGLLGAMIPFVALSLFLVFGAIKSKQVNF